jgi:nucleoside-diphosphate-sugar epimerase
MKNVSILGCGWLGESLAISLIEEGFTVKGSTTSEEKLAVLEASRIETYLVNILDFEEYDAFLHTDILIIAITSKDIDGFENLIQQIENSPIQKVIFISSTSVYPNINGVVTENTNTKESLLAEIEELFRQNNFFETTILRFAGLFGPERYPGNWFSGDRKIPQPQGYVNMIHQEDCIEIIHEIIDQNCWNTTLNACSNHHPKRIEFYTIAKLSKGLKVPAFEENEKLSYKIISSKKLQEALDYTFIHDDLLSL